MLRIEANKIWLTNQPAIHELLEAKCIRIPHLTHLTTSSFDIRNPTIKSKYFWPATFYEWYIFLNNDILDLIWIWFSETPRITRWEGLMPDLHILYKVRLGGATSWNFITMAKGGYMVTLNIMFVPKADFVQFGLNCKYMWCVYRIASCAIFVMEA